MPSLESIKSSKSDISAKNLKLKTLDFLCFFKNSDGIRHHQLGQNLVPILRHKEKILNEIKINSVNHTNIHEYNVDKITQANTFINRYKASLTPEEKQLRILIYFNLIIGR